MQWRLLGLQFVDNADADPGTDGVEVFTKQEHFVRDYSKSIGQEWSYKAYTVDKFRVVVFRKGQSKILYFGSQTG